MALSFFSSREIAEAFHGEAVTSGQPFEMTAAAIHRFYPRRSPNTRIWVGRSPRCVRCMTPRLLSPRAVPESTATIPVRVAAARSTRNAAARPYIEWITSVTCFIRRGVVRHWELDSSLGCAPGSIASTSKESLPR